MTTTNEVPVTTLRRGTIPLLVSLPHVGRHIHAQVASKLVARALAVEDTDWFLDTVYAFAADLGASLLVPAYSRYVIDLNRPPENTPMYPGANNTELVPTRFFTGEPLYRDGQAPDDADIEWRRATFWRPYHEALAGELARLRAEHGHAILWDGHSIKSTLPWLFDGRLPDLNLGTAGGASCAPSLRAAVGATAAAQPHFSQVLDGRFKGGHITRHYGRPAEHIHAIQLEMCWSTYMAEEPPFAVDPARTARLEPVLRSLLQTCLAWRPER
jgi:N-formylglutamate deformylase